MRSTRAALAFAGPLAMLLGLVGVVQAETVTLPATANAGLSSICEESARKKPDQQDWSWRGHETLVPLAPLDAAEDKPVQTSLTAAPMPEAGLIREQLGAYPSGVQTRNVGSKRTTITKERA